MHPTLLTKMNFGMSLISVFLGASVAYGQHYCNGGLSDKAYNSGLIYSDVLFPKVFDPQVTHTLETPIQIRAFHYLQLAGWNAWCNYIPKAADIFGRTRFKRPESEHMLSNKNVALLFSMYRIYEASPPSFGGLGIRGMFRNVIKEQGFDPDDKCMNLSTAVGLGNKMGMDTARLMSLDGWNQNGDLTGTQKNYNLPFQDYTGYVPKNSPWRITYPFRWQPLLETDNRGFFFRQESVVPQISQALSIIMSPAEMRRKTIPAPYLRHNAMAGEELARDRRLLEKNAQGVFAVSAKLTTRQRLLAEYFDNKVKSFNNPGKALVNFQGTKGTFTIASVFRFELLSTALNWTADDNMIYGLGANILAYESTILAWKEKRRIDAIRPTGQTMEMIFGDEKFEVWGGPGKKNVKIKAGEWQSYVRTMPHAEFPSASSCICEALVEHALITTRGRNDIPYKIMIPKGSSTIYPGQVPNRDTEITIRKISDWSDLCGASRLWAGVHFKPSVAAGRQLCTGVGRKSQDVVDRLRQGKPGGELMKWISFQDRKYFK